MFLRNERALGVKNGTLGTVERVTPQRMAVHTDDDRSVAFDTKDYAHIDHGYAATIHKAQGMIVDRDAQVESLLRGRTRELGIKTELGRDLARDLAASISMERIRSTGMGL